MSYFAQHHMGLVALSYLISVCGAFVALQMANYIPNREGGLNHGWMTMAAVVFGSCAIWAMHFTGMLAYRLEFVATYDVALTLLSLAIPIAFSAIGFQVVYRWPDSTPAWLGAGIVFGGGVAAMHYVGMAALRADAHMHHDQTITAIAIGIAIVAATVALRIVVHWKGRLRLLSPLIMGLAVCGMHYTAMMGMEFQAAGSGTGIDYFNGAWSAQFMGFISGLAVLLTLLIGAAMVVVRKSLDVNPQTTLANA